MTQILKASALYFALVFGAGFVLGPIRILWAVPRFGERTAELLETPVMLVVIVFAARRVARHLAPSSSATTRLAVGCLALALMVAVEFSVVLWFRGLTIGQYLATRDPVAGAVYLGALGCFAIMPLLVTRR